MYLFNRYIKYYSRYIKIVKDDQDRKPLLRIFVEFLYCAIKEKTFPGHYFTLFLYKKNSDNCSNYISDKLIVSLRKRLNDPSLIPLLSNKLEFNRHFSKQTIDMPNTLAYNSKNVCFIKNQKYIIQDYSDLHQLIDKLMSLCQSNSSLFFKDISGQAGSGALKIDKEDLPLDKQKTKDLFNHIISSNLIMQETIIQNSELSQIYPHSLNSIRIDTYTDKNGKAEVLSAMLRMGGKGSYVDNISAGGCFVGIDLETGKLKKEAHTHLINGADVYTLHPDTGFVFNGFNIPYFSEVKETALKAANLLPGIRLIGWDIVIGQYGPILLEGNEQYRMAGLETASGGYRNNIVFKKLLNEAENLPEFKS